MSEGSADWSWKVEDEGANPELGLLYEPGNWGDVVKAGWVVVVVRALARSGEAFRLVDPYAGAADYPLVPATAARLKGAPTLGFESDLEPHLEAGRFPSAGRLAFEAAGGVGADARAVVFDVDEARRGTWSGREGIEVAEAESGDDVLVRRLPKSDLGLVDPYDLFERWEGILPRALPEGGPPVVFYLYNKAPRSARAHRRYGELRRRLDRLRGPRKLLVGRVPSDSVLPRAYHEMLLVAGAELVETVQDPLRELTLTLSRHIGDAGAWEGWT